MDMLIFFHGFDLVPDVVDVAPRDMLTVEYPCEHRVEIAEHLTPYQVRDPPDVLWDAEEGKSYLLFMLDPDSPSTLEPRFRCWIHWFIANIPGSDLSLGETLTEYMGAAPDREGGPHRYVFLLYEQSALMDFSGCTKVSKDTTNGRKNFSIKKFAKKFNIGPPIAGNFFFAEFDNYVPRLLCKMRNVMEKAERARAEAEEY